MKICLDKSVQYNKIQKIPLYPPHSTLFYPKLPEGLISLKLEI